LAAFSSLLIGVWLLGPLGFYGSVIVTEIVVFGVIPIGLGAIFATDWRQWFTRPPVLRSFWPWAFVAVLSFVVAQSNLLVLFDRIYPIPSSQLEFFRRYFATETPAGLFGVICAAALIPAVFEEIAFRGLIQGGLRLSYGPRHAIIWTGLLFAVSHMNPWNLVSLWSLGCFLGYVTERTHSIWPAIFLHLVNNTFAIVLLFVQGKDQWVGRPEFIPWYWTALAGLVMLLALWRVHGLTENPRSPEPDEPGESSTFPGDKTMTTL
jgi:hypothetical protein